jgi:hypothetical protein
MSSTCPQKEKSPHSSIQKSSQVSTVLSQKDVASKGRPSYIGNQLDSRAKRKEYKKSKPQMT